MLAGVTSPLILALDSQSPAVLNSFPKTLTSTSSSERPLRITRSAGTYKPLLKYPFDIEQRYSSPYPSNGSLLTLFATQALPVALAINNSRADIPNVIITNSGSQRFDVYAGPFTKNDQLTASPFTDSFLFIPNITAEIANKVLPALNNAGADERRRSFFREMYGRGHVEHLYRAWLEDMDRRSGIDRRASKNLTLGYVTSDVSCFRVLLAP